MTKPDFVKPTTPLVAMSFFAADVQAGVGPFLGIYLQSHGWTPDRIGTVLTIAGIVAMLVTAPAGALVDGTPYRRSVIAGASALSVVAAFIVWLSQGFWPVTFSQIATAISGATLGPALAGLTLGIVGQKNFDRQFGRNQVANHAGNIAAALLSGWLGARLGMPYIFALSAAFGVGCIVTVYWIPARAVNRHVARGIARPDSASDSDDASPIKMDGMRALLRNRPLLVLAATLAAFNIGNSAMLPLYSLALAAAHWTDPSYATAANIVISQIVMLIAAAYASRLIRRFGFWWLILATLLTLPLRAVTAAFVAPSFGIVPVQVFDGIGAGLQSVAVPALVVHLLHGSGRVNLGQGAVQAIVAAGACVSPLFGGWVAQQFGYPAAFCALGSLAVVALGIWIGQGGRVREVCDTRRDELGKLADVDSSTLLP